MSNRIKRRSANIIHSKGQPPCDILWHDTLHKYFFWPVLTPLFGNGRGCCPKFGYTPWNCAEWTLLELLRVTTVLFGKECLSLFEKHKITLQLNEAVIEAGRAAAAPECDAEWIEMGLLASAGLKLTFSQEAHMFPKIQMIFFFAQNKDWWASSSIMTLWQQLCLLSYQIIDEIRG